MFSTKRGVARKEDVDDDPERPEVDRFGVARGRVGVSRARENFTGGELVRREKILRVGGGVRCKVFERAHGAGHTCGWGDKTSGAKIC